MATRRTTIEIANVSTISISGGDKERLAAKFEKTKESAVKFGGTIIREIEFPDGFFLEVMFYNAEAKNSWEKSLK